MNQEPKKTNSKPVVTYILILFTAAFFLMAFSLLANQRSNDQTLDELRQSISSLEEGQTAQDKALSLQEERSELEQALVLLQDDLDEAQEETQTWVTASAQLQSELDAMKILFYLEESHRNGDLEACQLSITYMKDTGSDVVLYGMDDTAYGQRYDALVSAILEESN